MLGNTLDYLAQIGPPAITIEILPRNESDRARFSKFNCKRLQPYSEAVGHLWLLLLAWKNIIFCYYCKPFQLWISTSTTLNTSPLYRYYTRTSLLIREVPDQRGGINEGCNSLIYGVLTALSTEVSAKRSCRRPSGLAFVTSLISIITP